MGYYFVKWDVSIAELNFRCEERKHDERIAQATISSWNFDRPSSRQHKHVAETLLSIAHYSLIREISRFDEI